jgi:hypothetical protein
LGLKNWQRSERRRTMDKLQMQNPKVRIAMLGALLLLPFLGLAVWYWMPRPPGTDDQLRRVVEEYGYTVVTPPSRLFGPGTIATVERLSDGTLQLLPTCIMNDGALPGMWDISPTTERRGGSEDNETFDSSAKALDVVDSDTAGKRVRGSDVSLQDIKIVTISDEGLMAVRSRYLKGTCQEAVIWNLEAGAKVCQPQEVIEADVLYKRTAENGLDGGGKVGIAGRATGSIHANQQQSEHYEIQGDDLFLGARVKQNHCIQLPGNHQKVATRNF